MLRVNWSGGQYWFLRRNVFYRDPVKRKPIWFSPRAAADPGSADSGSSYSSSGFPLDWDPWEDLFGIGNDSQSRNGASKKKAKPGYGADGQPLKDIPCPTCRGRGYTLCPYCKMIANMEASCLQCGRRGFHTCSQCRGEGVIWVESTNESAWESPKSRLSSHLQIADDAAIDSMELPVPAKRKTRRIYGPTPPEVKAKISRALKDLEARTGSISRRLRRLHRDPVSQAKRVTAIKKARGTEEARRRTSEMNIAHFKSPENRLKRSQSMIGVPFRCTACGEEGHRRHFCPKLGYEKGKKLKILGLPPRGYRCSACGSTGHQSRKCPQRTQQSLVTFNTEHEKTEKKAVVYRCGICRNVGHNRKTCPNLQKAKTKRCSICGEPGHNRRKCAKSAKLEDEK